MSYRAGTMSGNEPSSLSALLTDGPTEVLCPQCNAGLLHVTMKEGRPSLTCPLCEAGEDAEQRSAAPSGTAPQS